MKVTCLPIALVILCACQLVAQTQAPADSVFVFVQRTDRHIKYSDADVFHHVIDNLLSHLREKNVALAEYKGSSRNYSDFKTELDKVFEMARAAKATSVLYVVVDRPITKWLKVTVQCFDMDRKELWKEEAASGGGFSGEHGLEVANKRVREDLATHIGQSGMPLLPLGRQATDQQAK